MLLEPHSSWQALVQHTRTHTHMHRYSTGTTHTHTHTHTHVSESTIIVVYCKRVLFHIMLLVECDVQVLVISG